MANIDENTLKMALVMHEGIDENIFTPENTIEFVIDLTVTEDNKQLSYMAPSMDSFDPGYDGYPSRKNIYYIIDWGDGNIEGFFNKYLEAKVKEWNNLQTPPPHYYSYNDIDGYYYTVIHHNYEQSGTYNIKLLTNYIYYSSSYNWTPFTGVASSENYKKIIIGDNYILRNPNEPLYYQFYPYASNLIYLKLPQNEKTSFLRMDARSLPLLEKIDGTNKITELKIMTDHGAKKITELSFPSCKVAHLQTFSGFHNLTNLYLPKLQIMDNSNFSYLLKIKEINLPSLEYIIHLSGCFYHCPFLEYINLPKLKTMDSNQEPSKVYAGNIFYDLPSLKELHLDNLENIYEGLTTDISKDPFNLYLSNAVKTIYYNGLRMIGNLYFDGTKEEFEKIEKIDGWIDPQFIKVFHIFCKDGEYVIPEIDPNETKIRIYTAEDDMRIIAVTYLTDNFTAIIDWGDGTQDTINNAQSTSNANTCLHKYSKKGYYDVKIISSDMTKFGISFYNAVDPSDTKKFEITNIYYWSDKIVSFDENIRYPSYQYSIPWSDNIKKLQEGILGNFFPNASQLIVNFQNIEEIDNYVFYNTSSKFYYIMPQELKLLKCKKIGSGAFQNSTIKKIDAPALKELGIDAFIDSNLEEFSAPLLETKLYRNTFYREGNCIITIVHLESIKELPSGIFYNAPGRKKVDEYGHEIDGYEGLSLFISKKLEKIEGNTFDASGVDMNVNIYFDGLEQDWEMIEKENFWYYASGNHNIDITVICNDNTIYYHYSY